MITIKTSETAIGEDKILSLNQFNIDLWNLIDKFKGDTNGVVDNIQLKHAEFADGSRQIVEIYINATFK